MQKVKSSLEVLNQDDLFSNDMISNILKIRPLKFTNNKVGMKKVVKKNSCLAMILLKSLKDPKLARKLDSEEIEELEGVCAYITPD